MAGRTEKYRPIIVHKYREEGIYPDTANIVTGKIQMKQPKRMEIWFAELGVHPGTSVQEGCRPVLVISNDKGNEYAETVTVAPLTSKIKKPWLPTHLMVTEENIEMNDFYDKPFRNAMLLLEQITTIDKSAMKTYVGTVSDEIRIYEIDGAIRLQLGV